VFAVMDQTEEWVKSNGGHMLFGKMKNNAAKLGGSFVESPNAFIPGEDSVAERSASAYKLMLEGKAPLKDLCYDHREAPAETDMADPVSLIAGLRVSYGDSSGHPDGCVLHDPPCAPGHVDLDALVGTIWDPSSDPQESRADFLNQITHALDSWLSQPQVRAVRDLGLFVEPGETITLGFDGSRRRARGVTDATALIGCRVSDGHLFQLAIWEQPEGPPQRDIDGQIVDWEVPTFEVDTAVRSAFAMYNVVGFYADPAKWETWLSSWEADFSEQLQVKASRAHPIHWWMTGGRSSMIVQATKQLHTAITERQCTYDGAITLTKHLLHARRRNSSSGVQIAKEFPDSSRKIDGAIAAILAWQARLDAFSKGLGKPSEEPEDFGSYSF